MQNPEQFHIREAMKCAYFYAIYNGGAINQLYTHYPQKFVDYLNGFIRFLQQTMTQILIVLLRTKYFTSTVSLTNLPTYMILTPSGINYLTFL